MSNQFLKISGDYTDWNIYRKAAIVCQRVWSRRLSRGVTFGTFS